MIEHDQFNCLGFCWAPSPRYIDLTLYFISSKDGKFTQIVFQSYQRTTNKAKTIQIIHCKSVAFGSCSHKNEYSKNATVWRSRST